MSRHELEGLSHEQLENIMEGFKSLYEAIGDDDEKDA